MSKENNSTNDFSGADDPRVRSFLRQAAAIIASTRGLNEESRLKLRSLADHFELSDEQFDRALLHLKQSDHAAFQLNHWEKDFVEQIKKKFKALSQNILKVSTEKRIIGIANEKYQINEIRARQLIDHYVERLGVGRVSEADAREFVSQSIEKRIGASASVSQEQRKKLYDVGENWGLPQETVDELILERLRVNRDSFQSSHSRLKLIVVGVLVILVVVSAALLYWHPGLLGLAGKPTGPGEPGTEELPNSLGAPVWWTESTTSQINSLMTARKLKLSQFEKLVSSNLNDRLEAISSLVDAQIESLESNELDQAIAGLLLDEPAAEVFRAAVNQALGKLAPVAEDFPSSVRDIKIAFRANVLLSDWLFYRTLGEKPISEGGVSFANRVSQHWRFNSDPVDRDEYIDLANTKLANQSWTHLANTSWASSSRAAILLEPLSELTAEWVAPEELNQFRSRILLAILEKDTSHWREVAKSVEVAIEQADEVKIQKWIQLYQTGQGRAWQDFLGGLLSTKFKLPTDANVSVELNRVRQEFSQRKFKTLIEKHNLVKELAETALAEVNLSGNLDRPDVVAKLAYAANVLLMFESEAPNSFQQSELAVANGLPNLRDLVGLEAEKDAPLRLATTPTALEIKEKGELIERLASESSSPVFKRSALNQLAELASHFDDVVYSEAAILARYVLSNLDLESSMNIEKNLGSFSHWSNFGLAIADRIQDPTVQLDQAITVATLQQGRPFAHSGSDDWRTDMQNDMLLSIELGIRQRIAKNPTPIQLDWRRLQVYLPETYRQRRRLFEGEGADVESRSIAADIEAMIRSVNVREGDAPESLHRLLELMWRETNSELEKAVVANQLLIDAIAKDLAQEFENVQSEVRSIVDEFRRTGESRNSLGERLLLGEYALVKLLLLRQRMELERRIRVS